MNINQIGQKKKKQAVRRLSQSSGGHGNRKDDLRRRLGSIRHDADTGSDGSTRRFPRGSVRQGQTEERFDTRPFGPAGVKRNIRHSQTSSKRHASPLANTAVAPTSNTKKETSNIFPTPIMTAPTGNKNESTVSGPSDVFKSSPTQGNIPGGFQSRNRTWINETVRQPQQETQKLFGSDPSPNQGNVFGGRQFEMKTSKISDRGTKAHPSPLAGLNNTSSNAGGSIISGLANPNIAGHGNVSSLVGKYEQKATSQPLQSFPASSGGVFQSADSSMTSLLSDPQNSNVFSVRNDSLPISSLTPNSGSVFGRNSGMATTTPPQIVNLLATGQKSNPNTMISNSTTQNSTGNTSFLTGMGTTTASPNVNLFATGQKANSNTIIPNSSNQNSTGNTSFLSGMAPTAPPNVNLFATGQKANSNTMIPNSTTQNSTVNTSFFSGMANVENKSGIFGNIVNSTSAGVFTSNQNATSVGSHLAQSSSGSPTSKGSVFGNARSLESSNQQASIFGTSSLVTPKTTTQSSVQKTQSVFGNAGLSESSNQQANIFATASSTTPTTSQSNLQNQPGIFGGAGLQIPPTTQSLSLFTTNQTSNSPIFNSKPSSDTGSIFGGAGLPPYSTNLSNTPGTFSKSSPSSSQNFAVNNPDSTKGATFGNTGVLATLTQNAAGPFESHVPGGPASTRPASVFGSAGVQSDSGKTTLFALNKTDPGVGPNALFTDRPTSSASVFGQATFTALSKSAGPFTSRVSSGPSSTKQASIFGGAGLSATSDIPQTSGIFSVSQGISQGQFSTNTRVSNPSFSQSPASGSIFGNTGLSATPDMPSTSGVFSSSQSSKQGPFGNAGLSATPDIPSTSGVLSSSQSTKQGPFSTSTKVSNPSFAQSSASDSIFGNAGLPTTSYMPSTSGVFSSSLGTKQGPFSSKVSKPSFTQPPSPKVLKRSLSNTDVSDLTSIVMKGLTAEYFDKKLLERQFKIFGANKFSLQPTKQSIVVNFTTHEAAKKAKSRALELFPVKDLHVFWYKKKVGRTSRTPEKLTVNKKEFRSRRMSISNALNSIDVSEFSPAWSAQERFNVLDEVDKRIRQAITPYTHVASAPVIIGVCCDMCPEKERYMREFQANLSIFEMVPGTQDNRDGDVPKVEHTKAVKEYSRSAADKLEPLAHELRPVHVLQMTLDYLMTTVMNNSEEKWGEWFNFLWNRTRAIRKDITQQHLCDVQSADLVEKITRFHIFCAHYLCEEDMHSFDPKINNENLTKCLQTLKQFYVDLHTDQEVKCRNESEFQAYDILLNLNEGDTLRKAMQYHLEVRNSPEVKFALEVFSSLNSHNFVRFFKLLRSASYLNACLMHRYFTQVRRSALRIMSKAYSPKEPLPLQVLQDLLAFEDKNETSRFCSHYNFTTTEDSVQLSRVSFTDPETVFPLQRSSNVIESKRSCSVGQVVNGSPLTNRVIHEPLSSFDSGGRYVGLAHLIQMLGSTPDTPESPHYIYESPVNVPTEQRSPVLAVPADDPLVIFNKAIESTCLDLVGQTVDGLVKDISEDAIRQVELQLQLTRTFADKFLNDSLSVVLKEIAKECIAKEVATKKRKIAVVESRSRASLVVLNEIMDEFMKTELTFLAGNAKRVIREQMKAQSFAKMSAVMMREMIEDVMYEQCNEIALTTRKEIVKQKKAELWSKAEILRRNQMKKYFETWSKEFHTRVHIKTILQEIPAKPPMLTAKQQLEKLLGSKDSTSNVLTSPLSYSSVIKKREELQKILTDVVNEQEMKRLRAMQPINLARLYAELTTSKLMFTKRKQSVGSNCMKLVVSFPGLVEDFSSENAERLIKFKLRTENANNCRPIPAELQGKFEQLSEFQETSSQTREFKYDIKACYGIVSTNELQNVQRQHLLLGITGILFILNSNGQIKDKMFWSNCRARLRQILRSKPPVPRIPLVVMNINSGSTDRQNFIEEQLGIDELRKEGLISECVVYVQDERTDSDELHKQLVHATLWLMSHGSQAPEVERDSLKGFVEKEILKHFTIPVYEEASLRKKAFLQPQCPEVIVDLYNSVIDHVIGVVTNVKLKDISSPVPEFIATDSPPVSWNSSETFDRLYSILRKLKLPMPSSPAVDGTWHSEYLLCLDYIDVLLDEEPLKKFGFALVNRVERILSPYANDSGDATTFTAADIPWPEVIDACIKTLLSWLHTQSDGAAVNVYYLQQDLDEFEQPLSWTEAESETFKLVKRSSGIRKKKMASNLCDPEVEEELTRIETTSRSRLDVSESFVDEDMEETTRRFERNLGKEKRNWRRFEDQLRSILDEDDSQDLSISANGQGVKRKNPSWSSSFRPDKTNVKKSSTTGLEDINLPDLNSTHGYFETSLVSLRDGLAVNRHLEELTERRLREALDDNFE